MTYKDNDHEESNVVLPGQVLCTYEEYIPSDWTYVEDGFIKASIYGKVVVDDKNKTISICNEDAPEEIKLHDYVIGHVTEVRARKVLVTVKMIEGHTRTPIAEYKGYIHISKSCKWRVKSMYDLYRIGDIIRAKVVTKMGYEYLELSTVGKQTGVVKAMCTDCRKFMKRLSEDKVICECGKIDSRKISSKYGEIL